jgi:hypothetical protein
MSLFIFILSFYELFLTNVLLRHSECALFGESQNTLLQFFDKSFAIKFSFQRQYKCIYIDILVPFSPVISEFLVITLPQQHSCCETKSKSTSIFNGSLKTLSQLNILHGVK